MGSGISSGCGSQRSVLIANSVRKLPTIPEDESDVDCDIEIKPASGKLHPAESRDSGIGENELPHYLFQRNNVKQFGKECSSDSSPEKLRDLDTDENEDSNEKTKPSRPLSGRLGQRGYRGPSSKKTELSESQIRRMVRSAKSQPVACDEELEILDDDGRFSDDTLSNNSSPSPTRNNSALRPKSAGRRRGQRRSKPERGDVNVSLRTISDLDSSTDTEISDTDMLSIPDETGVFKTSKDSTPQRRGWVRNEDFTDVMLSTSFTPRVGAPTDMYRIVSGTYTDIDVNLAKKASERSISSIILTPLDGSTTPTNSECYDPNNDLYSHCEGSLEDLVSSFFQALERRRSRGPCVPADYENVIKGLRYQLVAMAMGYMCRQSTPRIEVLGEQTELFTDEAWRVQIRLKTEDEEIIESSEQRLAERLSSTGRSLTREGISILLAEHLKTIEKLQQVQDAGKLLEPLSTTSPSVTARQPASVTGSSNRARPGSASKLRKLDCDVSKGDTRHVAENAELPPKGNSKGNKTKVLSAKQKIKAVPVPKGANASETGVSCSDRVISLDNSQDQTSDQSEERISTDVQSATGAQEAEDATLYAELTEALVLLWDCLIPDDVIHLLREYRKRERIILTSLFEDRNAVLKSKATEEEQDADGLSDGRERDTAATFCTAEQLDHWQKTVEDLDDEFVRLYKEKLQENRESTLHVFSELFTEHMKKTRLIRVQSFAVRENGVDWNGNTRANSFTGFGSAPTSASVPQQAGTLKRQHSFAGAENRNQSFIGSSPQNSFIRSLPVSRQNSYCRSRSRGSTGSSYTYSTTSSGISSGLNSEMSDRSGSLTSKSGISRELSYGLLNDFEDIEEQDEDAKTARSSNAAALRSSQENLRPPSGRRSNGPRATSGNVKDKRRGQTQLHGLGLTGKETPLRKIDEDTLPKVEELDSKLMVRSRPDSGIAVSTSSASYSSSEPHKERDLEEHSIATSCHEMVEKVSKVPAEQHNDMKSLVAAVTKGLISAHSKAQALYCWLTSQDCTKFEKASKKSNSPSGRLRQLLDKKTTYCSVYMEMLKVAGLKCEKVEGYMKTLDYLPGNTVQTPKFQHSWVAVSIDGHYRLVDPQYGALGDKFVQEHYFATSPDELILSHFPKDKRWLLMNQSATMEGFEGTVKTWPAMFHFNIRPLNMKSVIRTYDGRLSITVLLQNVAVNPQLEYAGPGPEIDSDTLEEKIDHEIRNVDNAETYHVTLPQEGNYYFTVFAHVLEDCIDVPVFQYRIEYVDELL